MTSARNADRVAEVIGAVARQALADRGRARIALLDDGSHEARLADSILRGELGPEAIICITVDDSDVQALAGGVDTARVRDEVRRMLARLEADALPAHPANKTALLLGGDPPPEPLLPLGDLWATDVLALRGGWSASPEVEALAEEAGGIAALDGALRRLIDGRDASALHALPAEVAARTRAMLAAGSAGRRYPCIVPKLGGRTLFSDLYE
ncbi:MAG TPA: hypothetical protein VHG93_16065 [Longimicrobium sp.]|nr:hypothetical protein [Longimicrobium sp.]